MSLYKQSFLDLLSFAGHVCFICFTCTLFISVYKCMLFFVDIVAHFTDLSYMYTDSILGCCIQFRNVLITLPIQRFAYHLPRKHPFTNKILASFHSESQKKSRKKVEIGFTNQFTAKIILTRAFCIVKMFARE